MRKAILYLVLLLSLLIGWLIWVDAWHESVRPAGRTLAEHLQQRPTPEKSYVFVENDQEYLLLVGPWQSYPRFPSGPPMYVFDKKGELVDWTPDVGDDNGFNQRWKEFRSGREIGLSEIPNWPKAEP